MRHHPLGRTGITVSQLALGTAPLGDMFGAVDQTTATATVRHAIDEGINLFDTSPFYGAGLAEIRLGQALRGRREQVLIATKAGRYGAHHFDFSPQRIRTSLHDSLRRLGTDHVDVFQLHDIEFGDLGHIFDDSYPELIRLKDEGKCRFIGMTGYPLPALGRAVTETTLDLVLSYAHYTLLNTQLASTLLPLCRRVGTAVINAAAVSLGLLTPGNTRLRHTFAPEPVLAAAARVREFCATNAVDIAFLANQFSIQRSGCDTTVIGTSRPDHLQAAVNAATTPIDEPLLEQVLALTRDVRSTSWTSGRPENNSESAVT